MIEIPGYTPSRVLGQGGMACVYLAVQLSLGREVALKILASSQDSTASERFLREARIAASLHHPNIVPVHDFGVHDGTAYIAMEYYPAGTVSPLDGERLEPGAALRIVRDIAGALDYAHSRGVVHRDIKPDNILRRSSDGGAVLSDFGIARVLEGAVALTAEGTSVGTPHYMSPEQLRGEKVDGRSDLYSLGVVLWKLLTGDLPFVGRDAWAIGTQHLSADIPRLPQAVSFLQPLLDLMLAKQAGARPQTGAEVIGRIDQLLLTRHSPDTVAVASVAKGPGAGHGMPRKALLAGVALLLVSVLLASLAWRRGETNSPAGITASSTTLSSTPTQPEIESSKSIAVLPFVNMSTDADNQYFSDGISEELLNLLSRVDGLGVASRTSSFAYRTGNLGTVEIARELKVSYILEGSVRKAGNRVRITAQLIDARNDRHLWSEAYDREMTDIFAIQDEIANTIVAALRGRLSAQTERVVKVRADTKNQQAYELYLKARELFGARTNLPESVRLFEQAIQLDPGFARAWEGLAAVSVVAESWDMHDRPYVSLAERAARKALQLDPTLSTPWGVLGVIERDKIPTDWDRAFTLADRSVAADPKNATAFLWRSLAWASLGYFDRALADQDRCLGIDPAYQNCSRQKALTLLFARRTDEALALFGKGVDEGFVRGRAGSFIGPLLQRGERKRAAWLLDRLGAKPELRDQIVSALEAPGGPPPSFRATLERYPNDQDDPIANMLVPARRHVWLRDYDQLPDIADIETVSLFVWETFPQDLRNSAGFKRLLKQRAIPEYWRKHGFPPQCRPSGSADFECD